MIPISIKKSKWFSAASVGWGFCLFVDQYALGLWSYVDSVTGFTDSVLFYLFAFWFAEGAFPDEDVVVGATGCEVVAFFGEYDGVDLVVVAVHGVCEKAFLDVPDLGLWKNYFDLAVGGNWSHEISVWVDGYIVYGWLVGFVVLNYFLCSQIVHADGFGFCRCYYALLLGVEDGLGDWVFKAIELVYTFFLLYVPDHELFILSTGADQCHVVRNLGGIYPVGMSDVGTFEL